LNRALSGNLPNSQGEPVMSEAHIYPDKQNIKAHTHADNDTYLAMYQQTIKDPEGFWSEHGKIVAWI
ncbi:hypothetical protein ACMUDI_19165, partial [Vibrio cholerae]|uniref:hypothetical protein n=1 Tax=Vibrio cholerae TaxID=666 RepID=UPI0039C96858